MCNFYKSYTRCNLNPFHIYIYICIFIYKAGFKLHLVGVTLGNVTLLNIFLLDVYFDKSTAGYIILFSYVLHAYKI